MSTYFTLASTYFSSQAEVPNYNIHSRHTFVALLLHVINGAVTKRVVYLVPHYTAYNRGFAAK